MKTYGNKFLNMAKVLLFPVLMILILNPMEIYYSNITDFNFRLTDFIFYMIAFSVLALLLGGAVLSLLPEKVYQLVTCFLFAGSLLLYVQNMFLNKKLSNPDGSPMNWSEMKSTTINNTIVCVIIFAVIFVLLLLLIKKFRKINYISNFALIMAVIQLVAIVSCMIQINNSGRNFDEYHMSGADQMSVAANENIIVFIADTTAANHFNRLLEEDPSIADGLKDFTFYNNYESGYSGTYPAVLQMVTGYPVSVEYTRLENSANAWNSNRSRSFYDTLHANDFVCNYYVQSWLYEFGEAKPMLGSLDNIAVAERIINPTLLNTMMIKYSLYRCVPYILKPRLEVIAERYRDAAYYDDEIAYTNIDFYEKLCTEGLQVNESWNRAYILQHIEGMHPPIALSADVTYDENATPDDQLRGVLAIFYEYVEQLKELGVYDNSTIIFTADHGNQREGAIFFLKQANETHDSLQFNNAPIDASDYQATILSFAGADASAFGTTIFDWKEGDERERVRSTISSDDYYFNMWGHTYTGDAMVLENYDDYDLEYIGIK